MSEAKQGSRCPTCKCDPVYLCHHICDDPWHEAETPVAPTPDSNPYMEDWQRPDGSTIPKQGAVAPTPPIKKAIEELKAARSAWHEDFGVPVSMEYARFLTAIGVVQDLLETTALPPAQPSHPRIDAKLKELERDWGFDEHVEINDYWGQDKMRAYGAYTTLLWVKELLK